MTLHYPTPPQLEARLLFLNFRRLPGRLCAEETGWLLGFSSEEISVLTGQGLLEVLGNPAPKSRKWYASSHVLTLVVDALWLEKATDCVASHWRLKNAKK